MMFSRPPSESPRVLIVGGRDNSVLHSDRLPLTVDLLQSRDRITKAQRAAADRVVLVDLADRAASIAAARSMQGEAHFAGVVAFQEQFLLLAAAIGEALGVRTNPTVAVVNAMDKARTRSLNVSALLLNPRFERVSSYEQASDAVRRLGVRCVVKPLAGAGSYGVHELAPGAPAPAQPYEGGPDGPWLVEEYVAGPEFSIEAFSADGRHDVVAMTAKETCPASHVEIGHATPAHLDEPLCERVRKGVVDLLTRVGHVDGPSHTEVRIADDIPYLIETHTRYGGDQIWELTGLTTGRYPQPDTLQALAGLTPVSVDPAVPAAAVRFLVAQPGVVESVAGVPEATSLPGVLRVHVAVAVGEDVRPLRGSGDRVGYVLAQGESTRQAEMRATDAASLISILTSSRPGA